MTLGDKMNSLDIICKQLLEIMMPAINRIDGRCPAYTVPGCANGFISDLNRELIKHHINCEIDNKGIIHLTINEPDLTKQAVKSEEPSQES
uniref:Uncharacterized protein n=1 Tax=viral metagenome TaxID=1070528 RepID=A0A6M3IKV4_9ZZZZ